MDFGLRLRVARGDAPALIGHTTSDICSSASGRVWKIHRASPSGTRPSDAICVQRLRTTAFPSTLTSLGWYTTMLATSPPRSSAASMPPSDVTDA